MHLTGRENTTLCLFRNRHYTFLVNQLVMNGVSGIKSDVIEFESSPTQYNPTKF